MHQNPTSGLRALLPAGLICAMGLIVALSAAMPASSTSAVGPRDRMIAAVFPPWWDDGAVLGAAASTGLPIVRAGGTGSVLVVASPSGASDKLLSEAGALLLLDPLSMSGCLSLRKT